MSPRLGPLTDRAVELGIPVFICPIEHWVSFGLAAQKTYFVRFLRVLLGLRKRAKVIAQLIQTEEIDLVYSNTVTFVEGALAARLSGRNHLWHLREHVSGNKDLKSTIPPVFIPKIINELSTHVIVNSAELYRNYSDFGLEQKMSVVHNGFEIAQPSSIPGAKKAILAELALASTTKLVVLIGSLTPRKGVSNFIEMASELAAQVEGISFLIVGDGSLDYVSELKRTVVERKLTDIVHFLGWRNDIQHILSSADLLVVSSEQEAFGRTIVEAMAASVPVVSTRCGGPEEIVLDGNTGFLVPRNDPTELAIAVARVLADDALALRLGTAGRARAEEMFGMESYVRRITDLIQRHGNPQ